MASYQSDRILYSCHHDRYILHISQDSLSSPVWNQVNRSTSAVLMSFTFSKVPSLIHFMVIGEWAMLFQKPGCCIFRELIFMEIHLIQAFRNPRWYLY